MAMKPMLFSTPMVQAIQDDRKTQTRRVIKPQPPESAGKLITINMPYPASRTRPHIVIVGDDWGVDALYQPGDILWVRETWSFISCEQCKRELTHSDFSPGCDIPTTKRDYLYGEYGCYIYRANYGSTEDDSFPPSLFKWRSPIHMPKAAARLFLQVEKVRVERLQEITAHECVIEGIDTEDILWNTPDNDFAAYAKKMYSGLWDSLNAKKGHDWESNPWVEVTGFRKVSKEDAYA